MRVPRQSCRLSTDMASTTGDEGKGEMTGFRLGGRKGGGGRRVCTYWERSGLALANSRVNSGNTKGNERRESEVGFQYFPIFHTTSLVRGTSSVR